MLEGVHSTRRRLGIAGPPCLVCGAAVGRGAASGVCGKDCRRTLAPQTDGTGGRSRNRRCVARKSDRQYPNPAPAFVNHDERAGEQFRLMLVEYSEHRGFQMIWQDISRADLKHAWAGPV